MVDPMRALLCFDERLGWGSEHFGSEAGPVHWIGPLSTGSDAVAEHLRQPADVAVIAGDLDGCGGARVAGALARSGPAHVILLSLPGTEADLKRELAARELTSSVTLVPVPEHNIAPDRVARFLRSRVFLAGTGGAQRGRTRVLREIRPDVQELGAVPFSMTLLVGSAGTPHLLPALLGPRMCERTRLVIAVHHNPRWSDGFVEWVRELVGVGSGAVSAPVEIVSACAGQDRARLSPDLGTVIGQTLETGESSLICVASGMTEDGVDMLSGARRRGATVVALDPGSCPQPSMVQRVIGAGWTDAVVSLDELAWLIAHAGEAAMPFSIAS